MILGNKAVSGLGVRGLGFLGFRAAAPGFTVSGFRVQAVQA